MGSQKHLRRGWRLVLAATLLASTSAHAEIPLPPPGSEAWEPIGFRGIEDGTQYEVVDDAGTAAFRARSACSASGLALDLTRIDLAGRELHGLRWKWRVGQFPSTEDEQAKPGDDFAARVLVLYRLNEARATWLDRVKARVAAGWYGREMPGRAIEFVWTKSLPPGTRWKNPYQESVAMVATRSGVSSSSEWHSETVDLAREQRLSLDDAGAVPVGLAIMTDSDNTCSEATAWYSAFRLIAR